MTRYPPPDSASLSMKLTMPSMYTSQKNTLTAPINSRDTSTGRTDHTTAETGKTTFFQACLPLRPISRSDIWGLLASQVSTSVMQTQTCPLGRHRYSSAPASEGRALSYTPKPIFMPQSLQLSSNRVLSRMRVCQNLLPKSYHRILPCCS